MSGGAKAESATRREARPNSRGWGCCFVLAAVVGCGSGADGPELHSVSGVVTWNDAPLVDADVLFEPADPQSGVLPSQAFTDEQGRFVMSTHVGGGEYRPGLPPGEYRVAVTKLERPAGEATLLRPPANVLPPRYATGASSPLSATVAAGTENQFEFRIER